MSRTHETDILRHDALPDGTRLSEHDREHLIKPYLPAPRTKTSTNVSYKPLDLLRLIVYKAFFYFIQLVVSIYIRLRQTYHAIFDRLLSILYYHHRTPELIRRDVRSVGKVPRHLSVIVELKEEGSNEAVQRLIGEVAELSSWCACVGVEMLSIYERSGALKQQTPRLHQAILNTLSSYFPRHQLPEFRIRAPNRGIYSPSPLTSRSPSPHSLNETTTTKQSLNVLLLSAHDGRDTLVDLTKTIAEMSQKGKLMPTDVTTQLIHAEIEESCGFAEPDLLVIMTGPATARPSHRKSKLKGQKRSLATNDGILEMESWSGHGLCLMGYPPWQVRLTEIFQVQDSTGIGYQIFLRALHRYAKAELRFGR